jgi:CMP-N,N'-diacetyllegionaminic acid synthase
MTGPGPSLLGIVPARGGSKTIPRKNIKNFLGKPLLAWTIEAARSSGVLQRIILSTDDEEIARIGRESGAEVPFFRPGELAGDASPTAAVARHALDWLREREGWKPDLVMILEPTSPGRRPFHIREAAELLKTRSADSLASVSEIPHHYVPPKALQLGENGLVVGINGQSIRDMIHRRQDLPRYYALNGLIFSCKSDLLLSNPPSLWGTSVMGYPIGAPFDVDLDSPEDWRLAEIRLREILLGETG